MAFTCFKYLMQKNSRCFNITKRFKCKITMGHPLDVATGLSKRELLARAAGNDHPFDDIVLKRGPGTRECPTDIPSAFDSRIMGCLCHPDCVSICYMLLHKGHPKRCECGYWFKLVHKAPV